jgi:O-methyltransferase
VFRVLRMCEQGSKIDMYESTMDALNSLYAKVSEGGYIIVDDYGALPNCKAAIHDFRDAHNINDEMHIVDWTGVYWQKSASAQSHSAA